MVAQILAIDFAYWLYGQNLWSKFEQFNVEHSPVEVVDKGVEGVALCVAPRPLAHPVAVQRVAGAGLPLQAGALQSVSCNNAR